MTTETN